MSFLFNKPPQLSSAEKIAAAESEVEMISDMFNRYTTLQSTFSITREPPLTKIPPTRLVQSCTQKCIPNDYRESDLNKGESVCLDRCVSKMFDVNMKISEKMQEDGKARGAAGGSGGMGFGM